MITAKVCRCRCHAEVRAIDGKVAGRVTMFGPVDLTDPVEMALSCQRCFVDHWQADRAERDAEPA